MSKFLVNIQYNIMVPIEIEAINKKEAIEKAYTVTKFDTINSIDLLKDNTSIKEIEVMERNLLEGMVFDLVVNDLREIYPIDIIKESITNLLRDMDFFNTLYVDNIKYEVEYGCEYITNFKL